MATAKQRAADAADAAESLKRWLKPGDTVFTIVRSVSRSGMRRRICPIVLRADDRGDSPAVPRAIYLGYSIGQLLGWRVDDQDVIVGGCGMDMAFHLVYTVSTVLFGDGYALTKQSL